jgi:ATP-dependent DNA ligase
MYDIEARLGRALADRLAVPLSAIVSKKLDAPYKSGPSKAWLKIKNPKAPAANRAIDGTF